MEGKGKIIYFHESGSLEPCIFLIASLCLIAVFTSASALCHIFCTHKIKKSLSYKLHSDFKAARHLTKPITEPIFVS